MHPRNPVLALAAASVLMLTAGCNDAEPTAAHGKRHHYDGRSHHHGHRGSPASQDPEPSAPTSSSGGETSESATVAVYWVGDSPQGPRLFREFRTVPPDDPFGEAVDLLTSGEPLDPDYRSLLGGLDVSDVQKTGSSYALTLGDGAPTERPAGMSTAQERLAVQQLVYTLQAVGQTRDPVDVDHLFGEQGLVTNADPLRTLNLVSVTSPEQGSSPGDTLHASGVASSYEATVPWEIRQGDTVVKKGFATAEGWMDKLYPWETTIDVSGLDAGDYTFVAMTDDPSGGEGGGPHVDTKDFTIG